MNHFKRREIFCIITNRCNLSCAYCYEKTKNSEDAQIQTTKGILSHEIAKYDVPEYLVRYHGGEPFLAFDLMKELSEWLWDSFPQKNIVCETTTNGTCLDTKTEEWLLRNKHRFTPILSIDGPKHIHDLNRSHSYDKIALDFFVRNYPHQSVKMTVAPNTLHQMYDSFVFLSDKGFYVNPSLAREVQWQLPGDEKTYANEVAQIAQFYLDYPEIPPAQLLSLDLANLSPEFVSLRNNPCGAGRTMIAYDVNGNPYPCHSFIDIQKPYDHHTMERLFDTLSHNNIGMVSEICGKCFLMACCAPCFGLNHVNRENMGEFDRQVCLFSEITVRVSAIMYAKMLTDVSKYSCLSKKNRKDLVLLASGIQAVLQTYGNDLSFGERR